MEPQVGEPIRLRFANGSTYYGVMEEAELLDRGDVHFTVRFKTGGEINLAIGNWEWLTPEGNWQRV